MTKPPLNSDNPLIMLVRKALRDIEPRKLPVKTTTRDLFIRDIFIRTDTGWECPYCGAYCIRNDRTRYNRKTKRMEKTIDYSSYNMHFAGNHATPFWKEKHLIKVIEKGISNGKV